MICTKQMRLTIRCRFLICFIQLWPITIQLVANYYSIGGKLLFNQLRITIRLVANYYSISGQLLFNFDSEIGSWFIQMLYDMIEYFKSKKPVLDIMTKVNRQVRNKEGINKKGHLFKMHPTFTSQLNKDF